MATSNEDGYEPPIWLEYKKVFQYQNKKQALLTQKRVKDFIKSHPLLTLFHTEHGEQIITVRKDRPLFQDEHRQYYEKLYDFKRTYLTYYFTPNPDLYHFLTYLQEYIDNRRTRRIGNKHQTV